MDRVYARSKKRFLPIIIIITTTTTTSITTTTTTTASIIIIATTTTTTATATLKNTHCQQVPRARHLWTMRVLFVRSTHK